MKTYYHITWPESQKFLDILHVNKNREDAIIEGTNTDCMVEKEYYDNYNADPDKLKFYDVSVVWKGEYHTVVKAFSKEEARKIATKDPIDESILPYIQLADCEAIELGE